MKVQCSMGVGVRPDSTEPLTAGQMIDFFASLPSEARSAIPIRMMRDIGSQRDPHHVLVGLRVEWEEER